jgi:hypothetical protein
MHIPIGKSRIKPKPRNISRITPIPETHIVFNMNNEPAYKYSIFNIADKGFDKNEFMIKKLDDYVLYLETEEGQKYELLKSNTFPMQRLRWRYSTCSNSHESSILTGLTTSTSRTGDVLWRTRPSR